MISGISSALSRDTVERLVSSETSKAFHLPAAPTSQPWHRAGDQSLQTCIPLSSGIARPVPISDGLIIHKQRPTNRPTPVPYGVKLILLRATPNLFSFFPAISDPQFSSPVIDITSCLGRDNSVARIIRIKGQNLQNFHLFTKTGPVRMPFGGRGHFGSMLSSNERPRLPQERLYRHLNKLLRCHMAESLRLMDCTYNRLEEVGLPLANPAVSEETGADASC